MADQKFQALSEEWSALVDQFLETPDGQVAIFNLRRREGHIFFAILKSYADSLRGENLSPCQAYFDKQRKGIHVMAVIRLQEVFPDEYPSEEAAQRRCEELEHMAQEIAAMISGQRQKKVLSFSEMATPEDVSRTLEERATRRAPEDEIFSLRERSRLADEPGTSSESSPTIRVDASLKSIQNADLEEVFRAYAQTVISRSDPPPVHVSAYPASLPPAPEPGVSLGIVSSIPPPLPNDALSDSLATQFSPENENAFFDEGEITTDEIELSDDELEALGKP